MNARKSRIYRGFTLVELLVVITIIGVLAGLATGAAMYARITVVQMLTKAQMTQMEMALEKYKQEYGEYPPMLSDRAAVERHIRSRWKRAETKKLNYTLVLKAARLLPLAATDNDAIIKDDDPKRFEKMSLRNAASATFWLGGMYNGGEYVGFSADLSNPLNPQFANENDPSTFTNFNYGGQRTEPLMEFNDRNTEVVKIGGEDVICFAYANKPIIYFRSSATGSYMQTGAAYPQFCITDDFGIAVPYAKSGATPDVAVWYAAKKFQLVHPGRDSLFGDRAIGLNGETNALFALTSGILPDDEDNIVNFTETSTLSGAMNQ